MSAVGLPFAGVALTFASYDWMMSLEPTFRSTMYGLYYFAGAFAAAMALLIIVVYLVERAGPLRGLVTVHHYQSLGRLLFAFVCFWAYIAFSQYLLIFMANLSEPAEVPYYLLRLRQGWRGVSVLLVLGQFFIPFCVMMPREFKRNRHYLFAMSLWILLTHWADSYWLVMPHFAPTPWPHWQDLAGLLGIGGPAVALFLLRLRGDYAAPMGDPYFEDSLAFEK